MKMKTTVEADRSSFFCNTANYTCKCLFVTLVSCFLSVCLGFGVAVLVSDKGEELTAKILPPKQPLAPIEPIEPIEGFTVNLEAMKASSIELKKYLEDYYKSDKSSIQDILSSGLGISYGSQEYKETIDYLAINMKSRFSQHDKDITFTIGVMGSSVAAGHDNCNFDSYERQMERSMAPIFKAGSTAASQINFKVLNAGEGGDCGDSHENQVFCVRQAVGDKADIVHYSWSYFEGTANGYKQHEKIIRWSLMMERAPALQIFNTGGKAHKCLNDQNNKKLFEKYGSYGFNALCLESALFANGGYKGKVWEEVGDGLHEITRYGDYKNKEQCQEEVYQGCDVPEIPLNKHRKESLGVTWRNWHPGPLGFQTVSDLFVYQYLDALIVAVDELLLDGPFMDIDRPLLLIDDLGDPLFCSKEECNLEEPPGCLNLEKPVYGYHQIKIVDATDSFSPFINDHPKPLQVVAFNEKDKKTAGWKIQEFPGRILIPKAEKKYQACQHLDNCGAVTGTRVADSWLVFRLPRMSVGRIILCGCCGKKVAYDMFINNGALEVSFQKTILDPSTFKIYPNEKCAQVMDKFPSAVEDSTGHLYLGVRLKEDGTSTNEVKISHVIAF